MAQASAKSETETVSALKLEQLHIYWGETETIVSKKAMRINNKSKMGYCLVARAPAWSVTVFRDDDKKYMKKSLEEFEDTGLVSDLILKRRHRFLSEKLTATVKKVGDSQVIYLTSPMIEMSYLPLKDVAAPQVERILFSLYRVPTNGGIPLKFAKTLKGGADWLTGLNHKGTIKNCIVTREIQKVSVSSRVFDAPTGYTEAKSMQEVLLSHASRQASGDFDELFKIGKRKAERNQ